MSGERFGRNSRQAEPGHPEPGIEKPLSSPVLPKKRNGNCVALCLAFRRDIRGCILTSENPVIVVVGLGYVGLPLAVALATKYECWGLDIDRHRIEELRSGHDRTGEVDGERLVASGLKLASDGKDCPPADVYIVTVPTPVDADNVPDLRPLASASEAVGHMLDAQRTPIVIFESTVYPGVTEDFCAPILERASGLKCGESFFLGYSPERINPGDREHTIDRITKVVSGQNDAVLEVVAAIYGSITSGGVFKAASIKTAEAAKVIENAQRDINIAFMNEITQIFARMDLSVWDVLDAARTKWNFLPFSPGFVGGHCIGVDPYYLSYRAKELGHEPRVILSGRAVNDEMANWAASEIHKRLNGTSSILVLGITFKENVPDLRNSKIVDLVRSLEGIGHSIVIHDPQADEQEAAREYGLTLDASALERQYDAVILAVAHEYYANLGFDRISALVKHGGLFADLKRTFPEEVRRTSSPRIWAL
jgi:UDP-N-acetyl-D-glucosamine/UDP-N-acetyl-D-galactosamine dehydrogenase